MTAGDGATTDKPLLNTPVLNRTVRRYGEAMSTWAPAALEALIEEATVDAYGEDEQLTGFFTMIEESLAVPFTTTVLGVEVSVVGVDLVEDERMVARCARGSVRQGIGILDLPLPEPAPEGWQWIEAYRYWTR
ncbi:calcium-binding protein [Streptomyces sp. NBC_00459]|uniref:calcium-binding protein n=1 Tax=Streptomyces sp. NBC_00459 TaxID=2975749 RepID=UPI002E1945B5